MIRRQRLSLQRAAQGLRPAILVSQIAASIQDREQRLGRSDAAGVGRKLGQWGLSSA